MLHYLSVLCRTQNNGISYANVQFYLDGTSFGSFAGALANSANLTGDTGSIGGVNISGTPCGVMFQGTPCVFYQGGGDSGALWFATVDMAGPHWFQRVFCQPGGWIANQAIGGILMSESPSAVVYNNTLYVFYQGQDDSGGLWYATLDKLGGTWTVNQLVNDAGISGSPSAVVIDGSIYVFYQGEGNSGTLWYSIIGKDTVSNSMQVPGVGISGSPAAMASPDGGYDVYHLGRGKDGKLWRYSSTRGQDGWLAWNSPWDIAVYPAQPGVPTPFNPNARPMRSNHSPAVASFYGSTYLFYQDPDTGMLSGASVPVGSHVWTKLSFVNGDGGSYDFSVSGAPGAAVFVLPY